MLDIRFIRDNPELVASSARRKGYDINVDTLLKLDERRRSLLGDIEVLRARRNEIAGMMKGGKPDQSLIEEGREIKDRITEAEFELDELQQNYQTDLESVPNVIPDDTPDGGEESNVVERRWGELRDRDFTVLDHLTLGENRDWIDFERGAKVAGSKFYFVKGDLALLEMALTQYVLQKAAAAGFMPMLVPNMVNGRMASGTGYLPRGEERQIYEVAGEGLNLIATAEMPLTGYHADEILDLEQPKTYVGYSPSYRLEAGAYGKHSRGLFRVHQFNKVELYAFTKPEDSDAMHERMLALEEEICQELNIPYQVVRIAAGDLGAPAYKKYDIEYWSPLDSSYRELMSCSNIQSYQARRLNIRCKGGEGNVDAHTLNGTAMPMSRGIIAIMENYQQSDGTIEVPKALAHFFADKKSL